MNRVAIDVTKHYGMLKVNGLNPYPLFLEEDEAADLYLKLAEALDQFAHLDGGCEDDSCKCYARGAGR